PAPPLPPFSPLSLHDALPICVLWQLRLALVGARPLDARAPPAALPRLAGEAADSRGACRTFDGEESASGDRLLQAAQSQIVRAEDRKSTRLNSSHVSISYAVF